MIFVDAIVVKVRDGQVCNTPFYVVMGVTTGGEREILCIWTGDGGESARFWLQVFTELKNRGVEDVLISPLRRAAQVTPSGLESVQGKSDASLTVGCGL